MDFHMRVFNRLRLLYGHSVDLRAQRPRPTQTIEQVRDLSERLRDMRDAVEQGAWCAGCASRWLDDFDQEYRPFGGAP